MNKTSKSRTYPSPSVKKPSTASSSLNAVEVGRKSVDLLVKKKLQRKQEWNDYLTEDHQFRITPEELLKKKQLLVSKHNILSDQYQAPKLKSKVKQLKTKIQNLTNNTPTTKEKDHTTTRIKLRHEENQRHEQERGEQSTSLDLLELDSEEETEEDEISSDYDHFHHQSRSHSSKRHSSIADRSSSPVNHASTINKPSKHRPSSSQYSSQKKKKKFFTTTEKLPDEDLSNISKELILLFQELRYYEELSGKRSILQTDELMELLPEDELLSDQLDQKKVIRLLVNLVCQTMTYLLKNEVERATMTSEMELLKEKFHELQVSVLTRNTTNMPIFTSQPNLFSQSSHTTSLPLPTPPPPPITTTSTALPTSQQRMIEQDQNTIITTPSISPIIPSSQQLPSDLINRYLNISNMTSSSPAVVVNEEEESRAIPSDNSVRRNLEMQFQSFDTSATPSRASTATSSSAGKIQTTPPTNNTSLFTGSSPTDLLFSPNALSKFQQKSNSPSTVIPPPQQTTVSSTPPSAVKVAPSDPTVSKRAVDFNTTPLPSYQHADVSDFSTRTQDLLVSEYDHERVVRGYGIEGEEEDNDDNEEEASNNNSFDYEAVMKLKNKYLMNVRDSTESTIERLSQQYANSLTHNNASHHQQHQHQGRMKEEQPSVGGPNVDVPMPVQAPQHPFAMTHRVSGKDGKLQPMKNSSGLAVMPLLSEKRVHDLRHVTF